jgi:hypothetical protein
MKKYLAKNKKINRLKKLVESHQQLAETQNRKAT